MKKDKVLDNSLKLIRKYLKENVPIMNTGVVPTNSVKNIGEPSGLTKDPPVYSKPPLMRRRKSVQPESKYPR